jgi:hypothetical protein
MYVPCRLVGGVMLGAATLVAACVETHIAAACGIQFSYTSLLILVNHTHRLGTVGRRALARLVVCRSRTLPPAFLTTPLPRVCRLAPCSTSAGRCKPGGECPRWSACWLSWPRLTQTCDLKDPQQEVI